MSEKECVDVVDEQDRVLAQEEKERCHELGKRHRCAVVYVLRPGKKVLVQIRGEGERTCPGRYDHSAAGHVDAGETYEDAARRELEEELGIVASLTRIGKTYAEERHGNLIDRQFFEVFLCSHTGAIVPDPGEVGAVDEMTLEAIEQLLAKEPERCAGGFHATFPLLKKHLSQH